MRVNFHFKKLTFRHQILIWLFLVLIFQLKFYKDLFLKVISFSLIILSISLKLWFLVIKSIFLFRVINFILFWVTLNFVQSSFHSLVLNVPILQLCLPNLYLFFIFNLTSSFVVLLIFHFLISSIHFVSLIFLLTHPFFCWAKLIFLSH